MRAPNCATGPSGKRKHYILTQEPGQGQRDRTGGARTWTSAQVDTPRDRGGRGWRDTFAARSLAREHCAAAFGGRDIRVSIMGRPTSDVSDERRRTQGGLVTKRMLLTVLLSLSAIVTLWQPDVQAVGYCNETTCRNGPADRLCGCPPHTDQPGATATCGSWNRVGICWFG